MFLMKKQKQEIAKELAYVSAALITQTGMDACLFAECQEKLMSIADKVGGIETVATVVAFSDNIQKQLKERVIL